ncbi:hypothetical protein PPH41_11610 [Burkholderia gladioli]|nr:hypothetical protein [Burkholderia gladioli]
MNEHEKIPAQGGEMPPVERAADTGGRGINTVRGATSAGNAAQDRNTNAAALTDDFRGNDTNLVRSIEALIALNDEGALVPHGIGGLARVLLSAAAVRLTSPRAAVPRHVLASLECTAVWLEKGNDPQDAARELRACLAKIDAAPAAPVADMSDAYVGACEDLAIWKRRALEAEELNRKFLASINGDTHMGEPVAAQAVAADGAARFIAEHGHALAKLLHVDAFDIADRDAQTMEAIQRAAVSPATAPINGMPSPVWWINHGSHGQITTRLDEAERARDAGASVHAYLAIPSVSPATAAPLMEGELDALNEAIVWANDDGLPGTAEHLRAIRDRAAPATDEPCAHDYVRSDRVCTECGEKTATADEHAAFLAWTVDPSFYDWNKTSQCYAHHFNAGFKAARASQAEAREPFQARVQPWMLECFGPTIAADTIERNHRFLEEALELVQSLGCTASEAHQLVDYTFGRPIGEPAQEVGGVMVTLAALCLAKTLDMHAAGEWRDTGPLETNEGGAA